jgi:tetratricopeptide (TPR) repeat protein
MDMRQAVEQAFSGRLEIERELTAGGMSRVFVATMSNPARRVVVKALPPEIATESGIARFRQEIAIAAGLQHPHILPLLDVGSTGGVLAFTMPFVEGESLAARIARQGALPVGDAVRLWREVLDGLRHAHSQGVIHRDIKPDNILLSGGHAVITDFGIAKALSVAATTDKLTSTGLAIGTPAYMAPEQAVGQPNVDHRADLYSAAMVMWEMLIGRHPFAGRTAREMVAAHVAERPAPITSARSAVPAHVAALVERCLEKNPADRPQSAQEVIAALDSGSAEGAAVTVPSRSRRGVRRVAAVAALLLAGAAGAVVASKARGTDAEIPFLPIGLIPDRVAAADSELVRGVMNVMIPELERVPRLAVVSAQSAALVDWMRRIHGMNPASLASPDSMQFAAKRMGSRAFVMLDAARLGSAITITARVNAAVEGDDLGTFTETAADSGGLAAASQRLSRAVGRRLRPILADLPAPRELGFYTQSLVAVRETDEGTLKYDRGDYLGGLPHLRRAVAVDTGFAWGYRQIALGLLTLGVRQSEVLEATRRARELGDTARPVQHLNILGLYYLVRLHEDSARRVFLDHLRINPDAAPPRSNLATLEHYRRNFAAAERWARDILAVQPQAILPASYLTDAFIPQGRFGAVDSLLDAMPQLRGTPREAQIKRNILVAQRRYGELWLSMPPPHDSSSAQFHYDWVRVAIPLLWTIGRMRLADSLSRTLEQRYLEPDLDARGAALTAATARIFARIAATADTSGGRDSLSAALSRYPLESLAPADRPYGLLARTALALGDPGRALRWLDERDSVVTESGRGPRDEVLRARAEAYALLGRGAEAVRFARAGDLGQCIACTAPTLALAYESAGDAASAFAAWQVFLTRPSGSRISEDQYRLAPGLIRVAQLQEQRGALREALAAYDEFLVLWSDADPELHPRRDAVAARAAAIRTRLR